MPPFSSPPDPRAFNQRVWAVTRQIPPGKVTTYGKIASLLPPPSTMTLKDYDAFGARWVGGAMAACPDDVPWWRVINSQGKISPRPGAEEQRSLLEEEGLVFDEHDKIDLKAYLWDFSGVQI
jgi:methylated-DNA-protein-cysteine methyltransferase-like protein